MKKSIKESSKEDLSNIIFQEKTRLSKKHFSIDKTFKLDEKTINKLSTIKFDGKYFRKFTENYRKLLKGKEDNNENLLNFEEKVKIAETWDGSSVNFVIKNILYLSGFHYDKLNLEYLKIKTIVNCAVQIIDQVDEYIEEKNLKDVIKVYHYPIDDNYQQDIYRYFNEMFDVIDNENNQPVLVHCEQGISRASALVISYVMRKKKMKFYDALKFVIERRKMISPNLQFCKQLLLLEKELNI